MRPGTLVCLSLFAVSMAASLPWMATAALAPHWSSPFPPSLPRPPLVVESLLLVFGSFLTLLHHLVVSVGEVSLGSSYSTVFPASFLNMVFDLCSRVSQFGLGTLYVLTYHWPL